MGRKIVPFKIGNLDSCPECGATGDYELLKHAALVVVAKLREAKIKDPVAFAPIRGPIADLKAAIGVLNSVIDKDQTP